MIRRLLNLLRIVARRRWKPSMDSYKEIRALKFSSVLEVEKAIDFLYTPGLRECPRDYVGKNTIIVPEEAEELFIQARFVFESSKVLSAGDLPAEETYELRRKQGVF